MIMRTVLLVLWLSLAVAAEPVYDAELSGFDYPYPVHSFSLKAQGQELSLAYMDVRPERYNNRTVLLLHGKNFTSAYWQPTIQALLGRGFRVVAVDQLGFGKSSKPEHFQFSFQEMATDTRALLDGLHVDKVAVVGHSMGGMLATRFTLMFPERVAKLALVNPIGLEDWKRLVPYHTVEQNYKSEQEASRDSLKRYMQENYFNGNWNKEYDRLLEPLVGWQNGPDKNRVAWDNALTSDMIFTQPVLYEFPQLRVPTLLIIGQKDKTAIGKAWAPAAVQPKLGNYPALGRQAAKAIPGARLVELSTSGHLPQVTDFSGYIKALESFLGK